MRLPWILLPILAQGALGELFKTQPPKELVAHRGEEVTLECVTNVDVDSCAWKLEATDIEATGFLLSKIPGNLDITAREPGSSRDCTIIISNIQERYNGKYKCSPFTSKGQEDSIGTDVIIAQKPQSVRFLGQAADGFPLVVYTSKPVTVQCMAEQARPKAGIQWYLGNSQIHKNIDPEDTQEAGTLLWDSVSTLTHQFSKKDIGKKLRCRADHVGYDKADEALREQSLQVDVQFAPYRPEGNNIGRLYGFTTGQQGDVLVNFTANPRPSAMSWKVSDVGTVPLSGESLDKRFKSGNIILKNVTYGKYALQLTINPVELEDEQRTFTLLLENSVGKTELEFEIGTGAAPPPQGLTGATIGGIVAAVIVLLVIIGLVAFGRSRGKWCFAGKGKDKTDKPRKPRPLKARRPSASASSVNRTAGVGAGPSAGGGGSRRGSLAAGGRRGSRGAGAGKFGIPLSLAALKQSMSARPNRQRYESDDGSVEVGREEVTYVNRMSTPAGEPSSGQGMEMTPAPLPLVREDPPTPAPESAPVEPPSEDKPADSAPVEIPELEAPPRPIVASAARPVEADLSAMPRTPPTPISPILFPSNQPPAAVSSPLSSEVDSPASSRGPPRYPQPGQQVSSPMGPPGVNQMGPPRQGGPVQMGPSGQQRPQTGPFVPRQVGPPGFSPMGPPGSQIGQSGPPQTGLRGSDPNDRRGSGRSDQSGPDRWGSGPMGPGTYSNMGPALPERVPGPRWSQPAAGRQRGAVALPPDSPGVSGAPSVDMPPAGSREELGIPYPPPGDVRRRGPPLPPKNRPQSQVPAGAIRVLPGAMQSELSARFPSSPSLLEPDSDGSAV